MGCPSVMLGSVRVHCCTGLQTKRWGGVYIDTVLYGVILGSAEITVLHCVCYIDIRMDTMLMASILL